MTTTDTTKNFNIAEVHAYALKMKELIAYMFVNIYSCRNFGPFHFNTKMGVCHYKNNDPEYENLIFSVSKVSEGSMESWHSKVQHSEFSYKLEYFDNGTKFTQECSTYEKEGDGWKLAYHPYYSTEQLQDEAFLFQQSLVLDEQALFGLCCSSWLRVMGLGLIYVICEFDVDDMNRVHKVVFDDVRS